MTVKQNFDAVIYIPNDLEVKIFFSDQAKGDQIMAAFESFIEEVRSLAGSTGVLEIKKRSGINEGVIHEKVMLRNPWVVRVSPDQANAKLVAVDIEELLRQHNQKNLFIKIDYLWRSRKTFSTLLPGK